MMDPIVAMLVTAVGALAGGIVALWRTYLVRTRECEEKKDALQAAWREEQKAMIAEYKGFLRELVVTSKDSRDEGRGA